MIFTRIFEGFFRFFHVRILFSRAKIEEFSRVTNCLSRPKKKSTDTNQKSLDIFTVFWDTRIKPIRRFYCFLGNTNQTNQTFLLFFDLHELDELDIFTVFWLTRIRRHQTFLLFFGKRELDKLDVFTVFLGNENQTNQTFLLLTRLRGFSTLIEPWYSVFFFLFFDQKKGKR